MNDSNEKLLPPKQFSGLKGQQPQLQQQQQQTQQQQKQQQAKRTPNVV